MGFQRLIRVGSLLLVLFGLLIASNAQGRGNEGRWDYLGRAYVDGNRDRDRITVNNNVSFRTLQLEVRGGAIEFQRVVVHFENGADRELEIRERISSGGRTRAIDLPGERRRIRSVEFWYSPDRWRSRPSVTLFGQRSFNNGSGDQSRWEQLGQSYVDGRRDHDTINVNNRGTFRQLQLGVRRGNVEFQRVVVHFESGENHELEIRDRIPAGDRTRVIDLPGERRRIRSVEFWYAKENWRERPHVNLWGRR
jgi:hypothetical protein